MNIINDKNNLTLVRKQDIEQVQQEKQEFKLIETYFRTPGLSLFCYNTQKQIVEKVEYNKSSCAKVIDFKEKIIEDYERESCTVDPRFEYFEALNLKSAQNRVDKWKEGKIKLCNLRIIGNGMKLSIY